MGYPKDKTDADSAELTARKLKMVQLSFADESGEARRKYLTEALGGLMESILPDQRGDFLQSLEAQFPVWVDNAGQAQPAPAPAPVRPPPPPETPESLADRLVAMAAMMDDDEREALAQRLAQGRLVTSSSRDKPPERARGTDDTVMAKRTQDAMQYLMRQLAIERIDFTRTAKLVLMFTSYMSQMDEIVWSTWRTVAPQTELRRPGNLQKEICRYLSGDKDISGVELKEHVETMQKLMASLVAAVGQLGSSLARQHLAKFAPMEIQIQANREGNSLLVSQESRCWNRYQKLARDLEEDIIEHTVKGIIAQYAEAMMKRSG